jgi:hypothetical protein
MTNLASMSAMRDRTREAENGESWALSTVGVACEPVNLMRNGNGKYDSQQRSVKPRSQLGTSKHIK